VPDPALPNRQHETFLLCFAWRLRKKEKEASKASISLVITGPQNYQNYLSFSG
jgi:hypothetical protein